MVNLITTVPGNSTCWFQLLLIFVHHQDEIVRTAEIGDVQRGARAGAAAGRESEALAARARVGERHCRAGSPRRASAASRAHRWSSFEAAAARASPAGAGLVVGFGTTISGAAAAGGRTASRTGAGSVVWTGRPPIGVRPPDRVPSPAPPSEIVITDFVSLDRSAKPVRRAEARETPQARRGRRAKSPPSA